MHATGAEAIDECSAAAAAIGLPVALAVPSSLQDSWRAPPFCYLDDQSSQLFFNANAGGSDGGRCSGATLCAWRQPRRARMRGARR
jgi:hypothetical protein